MRVLRIIYTMAYLMKRMKKKCRYLYINLLVFLNKNKKIYPNYEIEEANDYLQLFRPHLSVEFGDILRRTEKTVDISIIIPVYNAQKYLEECLNSIFKQNTECSYEVICINDGSKDESLNILEKYEEQYENFIVITQENKGSSAARNLGLERMAGKYLLFIDADDFLQKDALNHLWKTALTTDASIVQGNVLKCNEKSEVFYKHKVKAKVTSRYIEYCQLSGMGCGKLYLSSLWEDINFFNGYAYEDTIVFLNIYLKCKKMAIIDQDIYTVRTTSNSQFRRQNNSTQKLDSLWIVDECMRINRRSGLQYVNEYYQVLIWHLSVGLVTRIRDTREEKLLEAAFVVARKLMMEFEGYKGEFYGKNRTLYRKIEESFFENNFYKWKMQSEILELFGGV